MSDLFIRRSVHVLAPLEQVFAFFSDAANLEELTPRELNFRIRTGLPIEMREGAVIDYTIRLWGIPMRWRSLISLWEPPHMFVDEQLRGPYRTWIHQHRFTSTPNGTLVEDSVSCRLPFGGAGRLATPLVRRELRRIFDYRERRMLEIFTAGAT